MLERVWRKALLHCWWECKLIQTLWRTLWTFLKKLKIELPYNPAMPLLGIYPEKTIIQKESCTTMFTAALFTIARTRNQPQCPSTDEWIKKMWHIYTMEYYSSIKRNEIELLVVRWMDLESVIPSKCKQIAIGKQPHSTGRSAQCFVTTQRDGMGRVGGRRKREGIWGCMYTYS